MRGRSPRHSTALPWREGFQQRVEYQIQILVKNLKKCQKMLIFSYCPFEPISGHNGPVQVHGIVQLVHSYINPILNFCREDFKTTLDNLKVNDQKLGLKSHSLSF